MSYSLTMTAAPAAGTFPDFLRRRYGDRWVLAPRMTDRLRRDGYERNITQRQYSEAEREWETLAYGAPIKSLEAAAPDMLAALRLIAETMSPSDRYRVTVYAAIAKAEGRA